MSHILLNVRFYFRSQDVADADSTVGFPVVDDAFPVGGTVRAVGPVMHRAAVLPRMVCVYTYIFKATQNIYRIQYSYLYHVSHIIICIFLGESHPHFEF